MNISDCVAIGEFSSTGSGTTPPRQKSDLYYGGAIPWVKSGELREGVICATDETVTERALNETPLKIAPKGALLVAMYGATVGRVARLGVAATTNQAICHIVPDPRRADEQYLFHALCAKAPELVARGVGGAQPNISQGTIKQTKIYLPPLREQQRIAAMLDEADELRRLRHQSLLRMKDLQQAIFADRFGAVMPTIPLESAVSDTLIGLVRGADEFGDSFELPYVRMDAISRDGAYLQEKVQRTNATPDEIRKYALRPGDMLFNTRNSRELVGKTALYRSSELSVFNNNIMRIRFGSDWDPVFLESYFRSAIGRRLLEKRKSGTTSVWAIYWSQLKTLPLPKVSLNEQLIYRSMIEAIWQKASVAEAHLTHLDALFTSFQHRAFRGEL